MRYILPLVLVLALAGCEKKPVTPPDNAAGTVKPVEQLSLAELRQEIIKKEQQLRLLKDAAEKASIARRQKICWGLSAGLGALGVLAVVLAIKFPLVTWPRWLAGLLELSAAGFVVLAYLMPHLLLICAVVCVAAIAGAIILFLAGKRQEGLNRVALGISRTLEFAKSGQYRDGMTRDQLANVQANSWLAESVRKAALNLGTIK
jgi:hypothetical protein